MHELILRFLEYTYGKDESYYYEFSSYQVDGHNIVLGTIKRIDTLTEEEIEDDWQNSDDFNKCWTTLQYPNQYSLWEFLAMINAHLV